MLLWLIDVNSCDKKCYVKELKIKKYILERTEKCRSKIGLLIILPVFDLIQIPYA